MDDLGRSNDTRYLDVNHRSNGLCVCPNAGIPFRVPFENEIRELCLGRFEASCLCDSIVLLFDEAYVVAFAPIRNWGMSSTED